MLLFKWLIYRWLFWGFSSYPLIWRWIFYFDKQYLRNWWRIFSFVQVVVIDPNSPDRLEKQRLLPLWLTMFSWTDNFIILILFQWSSNLFSFIFMFFRILVYCLALWWLESPRTICSLLLLAIWQHGLNCLFKNETYCGIQDLFMFWCY